MTIYRWDEARGENTKDLGRQRATFPPAVAGQGRSASRTCIRSWQCQNAASPAGEATPASIGRPWPTSCVPHHYGLKRDMTHLRRASQLGRFLASVTLDDLMRPSVTYPRSQALQRAGVCRSDARGLLIAAASR